MNIYDFIVKGQDGKDICLSEYKDKVLLIINSAVECGFTPQYEKLQAMYEKFSAEGFEILDFPCNQFGEQAPGTDEEILTFLKTKYRTTFPVFSKVEVNGEGAIPLYRYLVSQKGFEGFGKEHDLAEKLNQLLIASDADYMKKPDIKWNFTKFLVDRNGNVTDRFEATADITQIQEKVQGYCSLRDQ